MSSRFSSFFILIETSHLSSRHNIIDQYLGSLRPVISVCPAEEEKWKNTEGAQEKKEKEGEDLPDCLGR
jgi:hypothetical protein